MGGGYCTDSFGFTPYFFGAHSASYYPKQSYVGQGPLTLLKYCTDDLCRNVSVELETVNQNSKSDPSLKSSDGDRLTPPKSLSSIEQHAERS